MKIKHNIQVGSLVSFYDSQTAHKEFDSSGSNPKHYLIGEVINHYWITNEFYSEYVCDIEVFNRISRKHFVSALNILN